MNAFDYAASSLVNHFAHRSVRFDLLVVFISNNRMLKGGVVVGLALWVWFHYANERPKREALLAAAIASFPGLALTRVIELTVFRARPFNEPRLLSFHPPYGV